MTSANGPVFVGRAAESDLVAVRVAEGGLADAVGLGLALGWQLGLDGGGVGGLAAALAGLARGAQQPVEGGQRTEVGALVQQDGSDLSRGQVGEPLSVQRVQDGRLLRRGQHPGAAPGRGAAPAPGAVVPGWPGAAGTSWPAPPRLPGRPVPLQNSTRLL